MNLKPMNGEFGRGIPELLDVTFTMNGEQDYKHDAKTTLEFAAENSLPIKVFGMRTSDQQWEPLVRYEDFCGVRIEFTGNFEMESLIYSITKLVEAWSKRSDVQSVLKRYTDEEECDEIVFADFTDLIKSGAFEKKRV